MIRTAAMLILLAPAAIAQVPEAEWTGDWAPDPANCLLVKPEDQFEIVRITGTETYGDEFSCVFTKIEPVSAGGSWDVTEDCLFAGEREVIDSVVTLTGDGQSLTIVIDGEPAVLHRCAEGLK